MQDSQLIFSDAQVITANATTVVSTNVVDLGPLLDDRGTTKNQFGPENAKLWLVVTAGITPTAGTAIYLELTDCATATGTFKPTGIGVDSANAITIATLVPGYPILKVPLPPSLRRYLVILYTTTGNWTGSVGTFNARLEWGTQADDVAPWRV
jgi:hypothetical protein